VLKSTDRKQRQALGTVSNKLGDRNASASLPTLKEQKLSKPDLTEEHVFATPAPKKNPGRVYNRSNLDFAPLPKNSDISQLSDTLKQCSIQNENGNRAGSVCSTEIEEEYEDVFSQDSPAPESNYSSQPEVPRRSISTKAYEIGDDFTQPFITETETDHEDVSPPEIMYHAGMMHIS